MSLRTPGRFAHALLFVASMALGAACLTVEAEGTGSGRVIDCVVSQSNTTGTCRTDEKPSILTADPDSDSFVASWSGCLPTR